MDYNTLLDMTVDLAYELAMSGAETYRIEECGRRILAAYGLEAEVFAIPNNLIISIETPEEGKPMTRMRRIGQHGSDLDSVGKFSDLSRAICNRRPEPQEGKRWLAYVKTLQQSYSFPMVLLGHFLGAAGFGLFFGGNWLDALWAGFCGIVVGWFGVFLDKIQTNQFFSTIASSFLMALIAYSAAALGLTRNADTVIIGTLMILVPGLLFTNAMRDVIYGDTNSGINRVVQVFLIAMALALGTAAAWNVSAALWGEPMEIEALSYGFWMQDLACLVGCVGFSIFYNIHRSGIVVCTLGGVLTWSVYLVVIQLGGGDIAANFWAALFAGFYAEVMARVRKKPAISYLVVSIFPLLPGAGVYYTMNFAVRHQLEQFVSKGGHTAAVAGIMAVGILLASTIARVLYQYPLRKRT